MAEVFAGFAFAMGAGLLMVYGVMVLLFRGFLQPLTILFSLPLSIGGVILALLLTRNAMSMPVVIGILMLMGIVTKNAILLVDFAVEAIGRGMPRDEAIVEAGRKRARPIVMTTIAMIAGMVPAALAIGDGGEFRAPMAIAVIGGLAVWARNSPSRRCCRCSSCPPRSAWSTTSRAGWRAACGRWPARVTSRRRARRALDRGPRRAA